MTLLQINMNVQELKCLYPRSFTSIAKIRYPRGRQNICSYGAPGYNMHSSYIFSSDEKCSIERIKNECATRYRHM